MERIDFYNEKKWCESCQEYVRFLMSVDHSYCVQCGSLVRLFSKEDMQRFHEFANAQRPSQRKGRRSRAS